MFRSTIRTRELAQMCFRVGSGLKAGVDIRRCWQRETERSGGTYVRAAEQISQSLQSGSDLAQAMKELGEYFPLLVRKMVHVGEMSGSLDRILLNLAEHYQHILSVRRSILRAIAWPLIQLTIAIGVIGFLIWVPTVLPKINGVPQDMLGLGLVGYRGLTIYVAALAIISGVGYMFFQGLWLPRHGAPLILPLVERLPVLGPAIREICFARVTWSLALTTNTGMDLRDSVSLAISTAMLPRIAATDPAIRSMIEKGQDLHAAMSRTKQYPIDFLDALEVAEHTGMLSEGMERLSRSYDERAKYALQKLGTIAGVAVWMGIACILIFLIFLLYSRYLGVISGGF
jgi:type II secretory pathway component PulF